MNNNIEIISIILNSVLTFCPIVIFCNSSKIKDRENIYKRNYKIYKTKVHSTAFSYGVLPRKDLKKALIVEEYFNNKFPKEIKEIFKQFLEYIDPINLEYCLKNISTLNIKNKFTIKDRITNFFSVYCISGEYSIFYNLINLYSKDKTTLSHEFLHMASASRAFPRFCGFSVYSYDSLTKSVDRFGGGLNEGYTELLNMRIFNNNKNSNSYIQNVKITKLIECFFDDYRDMEYAYFHNDIDAVYKAFNKYGTREEYFMIMNELDCYASTPIVSDFLSSMLVQLKLYEIIKRSNDEKKIENFERVLNENLKGKLNLVKNIDVNRIQKRLKKELRKASVN